MATRETRDLDEYLDWQERLESFKASGLESTVAEKAVPRKKKTDKQKTSRSHSGQCVSATAGGNQQDEAEHGMQPCSVFPVACEFHNRSQTPQSVIAFLA